MYNFTHTLKMFDIFEKQIVGILLFQVHGNFRFSKS